jgi:hypothetical protein
MTPDKNMQPCMGRKGTKEKPACGPYCGLCQGTGLVHSPIVSLEDALKLMEHGLPQGPGYGQYYYGNAGTYSGTVVPGEMYLDIDLDWYGTKLLAAPTMVEIAEAFKALHDQLRTVQTEFTQLSDSFIALQNEHALTKKDP